MKSGKLLILSGLFLLVAYSCSGDKTETKTETRKPVRYAKIGNTLLAGNHSFSGVSEAREEGSLSFKVGGIIQKKWVKIGDKVSRGQTLVTIDPIDYKVDYDQTVASQKSSEAQVQSSQTQVASSQSQVKAAQASLKSSEASFISARSNYYRYQKLYETNSVSLSEFEQAKANYESAQAALNSAKSQVQTAQAQVESARAQVESSRSNAAASRSRTQAARNQVNYTRLTAPFNGIISNILVDENENVGSGAPVVILSSVDEIDVEIGVPEGNISQIKEGQEVKVHFAVIQDKYFKGRVDEVSYSTTGSIYPVKVTLLEKDQRIRPGMPANVEFNFEENGDSNKSERLITPPGSVGEDSEGNFVYVLQPEGKDENNVTAKKVRIKVGELFDNGFEVEEGIKDGQLVASAGLNVLRDGMKLTLYKGN